MNEMPHLEPTKIKLVKPARIVAVPDYVRDAINRQLDQALLDWPATATDRQCLYQQALSYYDEKGVMPSFTVVKAMPE